VFGDVFQHGQEVYIIGHSYDYGNDDVISLNDYYINQYVQYLCYEYNYMMLTAYQGGNLLDAMVGDVPYHVYYYDYEAPLGYVDYGASEYPEDTYSFISYESYNYWDYEYGDYPAFLDYTDDEYDIGLVPEYLGYGIMPLSGIWRVNFDPNGGTLAIYNQYRYTWDNGTIGDPARMNFVPGWPGGGRAFLGWNTQNDYLGDPFTHTSVVDDEITVYAVWAYEVRFFGNGIILTYNVPANPSSLTCYSVRRVLAPPQTGMSYWSFDSTPGIVFPQDPVRAGFTFMGWYDTTDAIGGTRYFYDSLITREMQLSARWEFSRHLITFEPQGGVLQTGTAALPQRIYRWAAHGMNILASGLTNPQPALVTQFPGIPLGPEFIQNQPARPWNPIVPTPHPDWSPFNENSTTGVVNPIPAAAATTAGTQWPVSAPNVQDPNTWVPPTAVGTHTTYSRLSPLPGTGHWPRLTISGWWPNPGGWENNPYAPSQGWPLPAIPGTPPNPPEPDNPRWALPGFNNSQTTSTWNGYPFAHGIPALEVVTEPITVYAHYVWRITFMPNGGNAGVQGFSVNAATQFSGGSHSFTDHNQNFRDVIPGAPRTINNDGRRVRHGARVAFIAGANHVLDHPYTVVKAGMPPPESMTWAGHYFNGWWCSNIPVSSDPNAPSLAGATEFTGDSIIGCECVNPACPYIPWKGGSRLVWAHWVLPEREGATIRFHLNAPVGDINTEGCLIEGHAHWSTHRPINYGDNVVTDRFFLSRAATTLQTAQAPYNIIPGPALSENATRSSHAAAMHPTNAFNNANVYYGNRHDLVLYRHYPSGQSITGWTTIVAQMMPRNPVRPGYVFMGWYFDSGGGHNAPLCPNQPGTSGVNALPGENCCNPDRFCDCILPRPEGVDPCGRPRHYEAHLRTRFNPGTVLQPGVMTLYARWMPSFDLILCANDGSNRQVIRNMAFGGSIGTGNAAIPEPYGEAGKRAFGRWPDFGTDVGMTHFHNAYHPGIFRTIFTRPNLTQIGPSLAFNFYPNPEFDMSRIVTDGGTVADRVFTQALLTQYGGVDPVTGRQYVRVYLQWGATLTFNLNLINAGLAVNPPVRSANIAYGHSVNRSLRSPANFPNLPSQPQHTHRHPHQPNRSDVWGNGAVGNWQGTASTVSAGVPTIEGTRGGWPTLTPGTPVGGHWPEMGLADPSFNLIGWNTVAVPTIANPGIWVDADTPIYANKTIFAQWGTYVTFHPGYAGDEVTNMTFTVPELLIYQVPAIIQSPSIPLLTFPPDPYWPGGRIFRGWHRSGDPNAPEITATTPIVTANAYRAVWYAYVVWHPAQGTDTGANLPNFPPNSPTPARRVIVGNAFLDTGPLNYPFAHGFIERPGGWFLHDRNNPRWFAVEYCTDDPTIPIGRRIYTRTGPPIMRGTHLYPEWLGRMTFLPAGGLLNGAAANISRDVPENLTLAENPTGQQIPIATRPNATFLGWRELQLAHCEDGDLLFNLQGRPFMAVDGDGRPIPVDVTAPLWTSVCINCDPDLYPIPTAPSSGCVSCITIIRPKYYFEAVWGVHFYFHKRGSDNTPLEDAIFRLYVYNGFGIEPPLSLITSSMVGPGANQWTFVGYRETCDSPMGFQFQLNPGRFYQLVEVVPPIGYQLPMGDWRITVNDAAYPALASLYIRMAPAGSVMPGIFPDSGPRESYIIRNWPNFVLPLTGGTGAILQFTVIGSALMSTGFAALLLAGIKRGREKKSDSRK